MSVNALTLATEAGRRCGDELFTRITRDDWKDFLNAVCRDIASRFHVVEYESTFDVVANMENYPYPDDMVQIRFMRYSDTPDTAGTYEDVDETPFDEWRERTSRSYPIGTPDEYCPRAGFFSLVPMAATTIEDGGLLSYWGLPADVTDLTTQSLQLPDFFRDYVVAGMVIQGKRKDKAFDEADALERAWLNQESQMREKMEDRARDRRASLRPKSARHPMRGMS